MGLPEVGDVVDGLRIDAVAGRGGMGIVYRCFDLQLERTVALKVVRPEVALDPVFGERFRREARLAASIEHPNIVPVLRAGSVDGLVHLVMRYVDGTDLASLLRQRGPMPIADATTVIEQIGGALDAAHDRNLVHRDVKPANIMVSHSSDGLHCYLTDFGISQDAREHSGLTSTGMVVGTVDYLAPELLTGGRADARSDLYALGCVYFECLTGRAPFTGDNQAARLFGHVHGSIPDAADTNPQVPRALARVVAQSLAKDPQDRYISGADLARAARDAMGVSSTGARGFVSPRRPGTAPKVGRRAVLGGAAALAAVGAGSAFAVLSRSKAPPARSIDISSSSGSATRSSASATLPTGIKVTGRTWTIGSGARGLVANGTHAWSANYDSSDVSSVDADSTSAISFPIEGNPGYIVIAHDRLWVWNWATVLTPMEPESGKVGTGVNLPTTPGEYAAGPSSLWITLPSSKSIVRYDTASAELDTPVHLGATPESVAVLGDTVWVAMRETKRLVSFDDKTRQTGKVVTMPAGRARLSVQGSKLWVYCADGAGEVTGSAMTTDNLVPMNSIAGIQFVPDGAWLIGADRTTVWKVGDDLRTAVTATATVPSEIDDLVVAGNRMWLLNIAEAKVSLVDIL